jgi:hypothetical protein
MRTGVVRDRAGGATFEDIPVIWALPPESTATPQLVIWLAGGLEPMQTTLPMLERLTSAGFAAVSFDSAGRGSRAPQDIEAVWPRALANWPNVVWPITAQGALETLRVIDWAARAFDLKRPYAVGGQSAGGDIANRRGRIGPADQLRGQRRGHPRLAKAWDARGRGARAAGRTRRVRSVPL